MNIDHVSLNMALCPTKGSSNLFQGLVDAAFKDRTSPHGLNNILGLTLSSPFESFTFERQGEDKLLPFLFAQETEEYVGFYQTRNIPNRPEETFFIKETEMLTLDSLRLTNRYSSHKGEAVSIVLFKVTFPYLYPPIFPEEAVSSSLVQTPQGGTRVKTTLGGQGLALKAAGYDSLIAANFGPNNYDIVLMQPSRTITRATHLKF